jgi:hypothetical protein
VHCCSEQSLIVSSLGSIEVAMPLVSVELQARYQNWDVQAARAELGEGLRSCVHQRDVIFFSVLPELVRIKRVLRSTAHAISAMGVSFHRINSEDAITASCTIARTAFFPPAPIKGWDSLLRRAH